MALPNVDIIRQNGQISRPPADADGISGFLFYTNGVETAVQAKLFTTLDALNYTTVTSVLYFHISEYFRLSTYPLYLSIVKNDPSDFNEIESLKNFSNGEIRQYATFNYRTAYTSSHITGLQAIAETIELEYAPGQMLYTGSIGSGTSGTALASLTDLSTLQSPRVSFIIAEDLSGRAATIRSNTNKFVSAIGTCLGSVSKSSVEKSIAWVGNNNLVGTEMTTVGFINGVKLSDTSISLQNTLNGYHYISFRTVVDLSGVYWNYAWTCDTATTSDFSTIELNRVYDSAFRKLRSAYVPQINASIYVNKDGTITNNQIIYFKNIGEIVLQFMKDAGNISDFTIDIDPTQQPIIAGGLVIVATLIPVGVASEITIKMGYAI